MRRHDLANKKSMTKTNIFAATMAMGSGWFQPRSLWQASLKMKNALWVKYFQWHNKFKILYSHSLGAKIYARPIIDQWTQIWPPTVCCHHQPGPSHYIPLWWWTSQVREVFKRNGYFTVRLTVRVDPPAPLYGHFFQGVHLTFEYDKGSSQKKIR